MTQRISLKEAERKAFRSMFQDGIWDIYLGSLLLLMGLGPVMGSKVEDGSMTIIQIMGILVGLACIPVLGFWASKKFITTPRIGLVEFSPGRKAKRKKMRLILSVSVLVGVILLLVALVMMNNPPKWISVAWLIPTGIWGINSVVIFSLGAYYLDFPRAYIYGWLFALPFPASILLYKDYDLPLILPYAVISGGMMLVGVVLFIRFLRDYPLPEGRVYDGPNG
jgi:hypothetical protein